MQHEEFSDHELWMQLSHIDPKRAAIIHQHDRYRVERALLIWHQTQQKPSQFVPFYNPPASVLVVHLTRDRDDLYKRINSRVKAMIAGGWLQEVRALLGTEWELFIQNKKIIGYNELVNYIHMSDQSAEIYTKMIEKIQQRTRHYAKRQETFWRGFKKMLDPYVSEHSEPSKIVLQEYNLSLTDERMVLQSILSAIGSLRSFNE